MTQNQRILAHLMAGGELSAMDALHQFGCFRLAARISDLRLAGHDIERRFTQTALSGKTVAVYYMKYDAIKRSRKQARKES